MLRQRVQASSQNIIHSAGVAGHFEPDRLGNKDTRKTSILNEGD